MILVYLTNGVCRLVGLLSKGIEILVLPQRIRVCENKAGGNEAGGNDTNLAVLHDNFAGNTPDRDGNSVDEGPPQSKACET